MEESQTHRTFIEEPILFFGNDVRFSYPPRFDEQVAETKARGEVWVKDYIEKNPHDAEQEDYIKNEDLERRVDRVKFEWYEQRFRGRYFSDELINQYPDAYNALNSQEDEVELPPTDRIAEFLNTTLAEQHWYGSYAFAANWEYRLPDDSPDKALARDYTAFAGNIVVTEYCRRAVQLAIPQFANDDAVRVKHLISVCWPLVERLEEYVPEEMASKKQLLREVFLEYATQSIGGIRHYVDMLIPDKERVYGDFKARREQEEQTLTELVRMDNLSPEKSGQFYAKLDSAVKELVDDQKYYEAIDLLDMSRKAVDLPPEDITPQINKIARQAVNHYTTDMSKFNDRPVPGDVIVDFTDYELTNQERTDMIITAPGVSDEMMGELMNITVVRESEYLITQLITKEGLVNAKAAHDLLQIVASAEPEATQGIRDEHLNTVLSLFKDKSLFRHHSPASIDRQVDNLARANSKNAHVKESLPEVMATAMDNLVELTKESTLQTPIEYAVAMMSPILRGSKVQDDPNNEAVWGYISKNSLNELLLAVEDHGVNNPEEQAFIDGMRSGIDQNIRQWWEQYWDEVEEYGW